MAGSQKFRMSEIWHRSSVRGGHGSEGPSRRVFLLEPEPESKLCEKLDQELESFFNFGGSRSLCGHFLCKNIVNFGWIDDRRILNRKSQIWNISGPGNFWFHAMYACTEKYFRLHNKYVEKTDDWWLGLRDLCLGKCVGLGLAWEKEK